MSSGISGVGWAIYAKLFCGHLPIVVIVSSWILCSRRVEFSVFAWSGFMIACADVRILTWLINVDPLSDCWRGPAAGPTGWIAYSALHI